MKNTEKIAYLIVFFCIINICSMEKDNLPPLLNPTLLALSQRACYPQLIDEIYDEKITTKTDLIKNLCIPEKLQELAISCYYSLPIKKEPVLITAHDSIPFIAYATRKGDLASIRLFNLTTGLDQRKTGYIFTPPITISWGSHQEWIFITDNKKTDATRNGALLNISSGRFHYLFHKEKCTDPCWSPSGKKLAISQEVANTYAVHIYCLKNSNKDSTTSLKMIKIPQSNPIKKIVWRTNSEIYILSKNRELLSFTLNKEKAFFASKALNIFDVVSFNENQLFTMSKNDKNRQGTLFSIHSQLIDTPILLWDPKSHIKKFFCNNTATHFVMLSKEREAEIVQASHIAQFSKVNNQIKENEPQNKSLKTMKLGSKNNSVSKFCWDARGENIFFVFDDRKVTYQNSFDTQKVDLISPIKSIDCITWAEKGKKLIISRENELIVYPTRSIFNEPNYCQTAIIYAALAGTISMCSHNQTPAHIWKFLHDDNQWEKQTELQKSLIIFMRQKCLQCYGN